MPHELAGALSTPARVLFVYWGRRGGGARMALGLAQAAVRHPGYAATVSISRDNELFEAFAPLGDAVFPVETFASNAGAVTKAWRLPALKRQLLARLRRDRTQAVVTVMPHVWSPVIAPAIRRAGVPYVTIAHDGAAHPGDHTGMVHGWLMRDCRHADLVLTLSEAVASHVRASTAGRDKRVVALFSPDMGPLAGDVGGQGAAASAMTFPADGAPLRLAFVGRVMPYKGLAMLADAVRLARARGLSVTLGVFGQGDLSAEQAQLKALGAEVDNRWQSEAELAAILARHHVVVLAHTEASQSGVAALAGGHGVPVIVTPVGGLAEQVDHGRTGLIAAAATPAALAEAISVVALDGDLYNAMCRHIRESREARSFTRFLDAVLDVLPLRRA